MPGLFPLIALSLAVSLDGLAAGFAYGVKTIKIPLNSLILLSVTSGLSIAISMFFGNLVADFVSPYVAEFAGGLILIILGIWFIYQNFIVIGDASSRSNRTQKNNLLGNVMENPTEADLDESGVISLKEAIILGVALAMDAFSAGFAASLMGFHSVITPFFVGLGKLILVPIGVKFGFQLFTNMNKSVVAFLPGMILIMLGVLSFF